MISKMDSASTCIMHRDKIRSHNHRTIRKAQYNQPETGTTKEEAIHVAIPVHVV